MTFRVLEILQNNSRTFQEAWELGTVLNGVCQGNTNPTFWYQS